MDFSSFFLFMGQQTPIIIIFAFLYCFLNRQGASRLLFLLLFSMIMNAALKCFFKMPLKPHMADQNWYAFPSGHMQMCVVFYGYVGWLMRNQTKWVWALLPLLGLYGWALIDQNYHDLADVLAGAAVGVVLLALFLWLETMRWIQEKWRFTGVLLLPFTVVLLFYITGAVSQKVAPAWQAQGGLLGLSAGLLCCHRFFSLFSPFKIKAVHTTVGLLGFCGL